MNSLKNVAKCIGGSMVGAFLVYLVRDVVVWLWEEINT